jgi:hypothetical protein
MVGVMDREIAELEVTVRMMEINQSHGEEFL